jgi:signal transduction histidine kinase
LAYRWLQDRRLAQVQTLVEERTSQLQWSLEMQGKLGERMRHQIEELQKLHQLKDEFLSAISHELHTPLSTMKIAVKMLRQGDRSAPRKARYLDILDQELQREQQLIQALLHLQKLEHQAPSLQGEPTFLEPLLAKLAHTFTSQWHQQKGLTLHWIAPPEPWPTDAAELEAILRELLHNAGKYAASQTPVHLEARISGDQLQLHLTNQGQGIPPAEQEAIFEKFRRGQGAIAQAIPGTGLGLALVKARVQQLNGTIGVISLPPAAETAAHWSTTFSLVLPPLVSPP